MITVTAEIHPERFYEFGRYADRKMREVTKEGLDVGQRYMTSIVPRGDTNRLASAVASSGPFTIMPGHYVGAVGVHGSIAPHAEHVDRGTGVDGPYHSAVSVHRPPRVVKPGSRRMTGAMRFQKKGEPPRYRRTVKALPSLKIQRGKNFSGRTFDAMRDWARVRTGVLAIELTLFLTEHRDI